MKNTTQLGINKNNKRNSPFYYNNENVNENNNEKIMMRFITSGFGINIFKNNKNENNMENENQEYSQSSNMKDAK